MSATSWGALTARERAWADLMRLKVMAGAADRELAPTLQTELDLRRVGLSACDLYGRNSCGRLASTCVSQALRRFLSDGGESRLASRRVRRGRAAEQRRELEQADDDGGRRLPRSWRAGRSSCGPHVELSGGVPPPCC